MNGIGVNLYYLRGGSEKNPSDYYGKTITKASISEESMAIELDNSTTIEIFDDGQSCCESRYITCDDDVSALIGQKLVEISSFNGDSKENEWGDEHEWVFVEVKTDKDHIKFCCHNEHNGYYGGFGLSVREI